jgi:hypothetical protein
MTNTSRRPAAQEHASGPPAEDPPRLSQPDQADPVELAWYVAPSVPCPKISILFTSQETQDGSEVRRPPAESHDDDHVEPFQYFRYKEPFEPRTTTSIRLLPQEQASGPLSAGCDVQLGEARAWQPPYCPNPITPDIGSGRYADEPSMTWKWRCVPWLEPELSAYPKTCP